MLLARAAALVEDLDAEVSTGLARLADAVARRGSAPTLGGAACHARARVRLLGRRELLDRHGAHRLGGRVAELVVLLTVRGPRLRSEEAADALWPDVPPRRGRERLRTVLARTRRQVGPVISRHHDGVAVAQGLDVDLWEFDRLADRALQQRGPAATACARAALELFDEQVAPGLGADHTWLATARERHRMRGLALHDRLADAAEDAGRPHEAATVLLSALRLDPLAEHRVARTGRVLAAAGDRGRALDLLDRVCDRLHREGLGAGPELRDLTAYLRRRV